MTRFQCKIILFCYILPTNEHTQVRSSICYAIFSTDMPWSAFNRFAQNAAHSLFAPRLEKF